MGAGVDELVGLGVAVGVGAADAEALVVALDAAGDDVDVDAAAGDLVQGGGLLGEESDRGDAGTYSDQQPDPR